MDLRVKDICEVRVPWQHNVSVGDKVIIIRLGSEDNPLAYFEFVNKPDYIGSKCTNISRWADNFNLPKRGPLKKLTLKDLLPKEVEV